MTRGRATIARAIATAPFPLTQARFLESPRRAWNECGLASRALVVAASPFFATGVAIKCEARVKQTPLSPVTPSHLPVVLLYATCSVWPLLREARDLAPLRLRRPHQGGNDRHRQDHAQSAVVAVLPRVHRAARLAVEPRASASFG
eukprot:scaffold11939_cov73-Phaeocystis_antarctica.AAC.5